MATHYHGSKGPVEIASMNYHHLCSARDKLVRDGFGKVRAAEIAAMTSRIDAADAEYLAEQQTQAGEA